MKYFAAFVVSVLWTSLSGTAQAAGSQPSSPGVMLVSSGQAWGEAYASCKSRFVKSLLVPKTSNLTELQDILPEDQSYVWLGGRVHYTDWKWTDGCDLVLEEGCKSTNNLYPSRIIESYQDPLHCLQRCKTASAALQETKCLCLETLPQPDTEQDVCSYRCIDNFDRRCGSPFSASVYTLSVPFSSSYSVSPFIVWDTESGFADKACAYTYLSSSWPGRVMVGADDCESSAAVKRPAVCQKCSDTTSDCPLSIINSPMTWLDAQASCQFSGQKLVTLTSGTNFSLLFQQPIAQDFWIGLRRQAELRWLNGSKVSGAVYSGSQGQTVGLCLAAKRNAGGDVTVDALNCSRPLPFLCDESEIDSAPLSQRPPCPSTTSRTTSTSTTSTGARAATSTATTLDVSPSTLTPPTLSTFDPTTSVDGSTETVTTTISETASVVTASSPSENGFWQTSATQPGGEVTSHLGNRSVPVIKGVSTRPFTLSQPMANFSDLSSVSKDTSSLSGGSSFQENWRVSETGVYNRMFTNFPKVTSETTPAEISTSLSRDSASELSGTVGPWNILKSSSQSENKSPPLAVSPSSDAPGGSQAMFPTTPDSNARPSEMFNSLAPEPASSTEAATSTDEKSVTSIRPQQPHVLPGLNTSPPVTAQSQQSQLPMSSGVTDSQLLAAESVSARGPQSDEGWAHRDSTVTLSKSGSEKTGTTPSFVTSHPGDTPRAAKASGEKRGSDLTPVYVVVGVVGALAVVAVVVVVIVLRTKGRFQFLTRRSAADRTSSENSVTIDNRMYGGPVTREEFVVVEKHEDR